MCHAQGFCVMIHLSGLWYIITACQELMFWNRVASILQLINSWMLCIYWISRISFDVLFFQYCIGLGFSTLRMDILATDFSATILLTSSCSLWKLENLFFSNHLWTPTLLFLAMQFTLHLAHSPCTRLCIHHMEMH